MSNSSNSTEEKNYAGDDSSSESGIESVIVEESEAEIQVLRKVMEKFIQNGIKNQKLRIDLEELLELDSENKKEKEKQKQAELEKIEFIKKMEQDKIDKKKAKLFFKQYEKDLITPLPEIHPLPKDLINRTTLLDTEYLKSPEGQKVKNILDFFFEKLNNQFNERIEEINRRYKIHEFIMFFLFNKEKLNYERSSNIWGWLRKLNEDYDQFKLVLERKEEERKEGQNERKRKSRLNQDKKSDLSIPHEYIEIEKVARKLKRVPTVKGRSSLQTLQSSDEKKQLHPDYH
jgi:hypothetical protein